MTKQIISILIIILIALHGLPIIQELRGHRQTFWPFMVWGMYRFSHDSESPIVKTVRRTIGVTSNNEQIDIESMHWPKFFNLLQTKNSKELQLVGLNASGLRRLYLSPIWKGDASAARRLAHWLNQKLDYPIIAFRLESETYMITDAGLVKTANPTITYRVTN